jgi:hypothetical protein
MIGDLQNDLREINPIFDIFYKLIFDITSNFFYHHYFLWISNLCVMTLSIIKNVILQQPTINKATVTEFFQDTDITKRRLPEFLIYRKNFEYTILLLF